MKKTLYFITLIILVFNQGLSSYDNIESNIRSNVGLPENTYDTLHMISDTLGDIDPYGHRNGKSSFFITFKIAFTSKENQVSDLRKLSNILWKVNWQCKNYRSVISSVNNFHNDCQNLTDLLKVIDYFFNLYKKHGILARVIDNASRLKEKNDSLSLDEKVKNISVETLLSKYQCTKEHLTEVKRLFPIILKMLNVSPLLGSFWLYHRLISCPLDHLKDIQRLGIVGLLKNIELDNRYIYFNFYLDMANDFTLEEFLVLLKLNPYVFNETYQTGMERYQRTVSESLLNLRLEKLQCLLNVVPDIFSNKPLYEIAILFEDFEKAPDIAYLSQTLNRHDLTLEAKTGLFLLKIGHLVEVENPQEHWQEIETIMPQLFLLLTHPFDRENVIEMISDFSIQQLQKLNEFNIQNLFRNLNDDQIFNCLNIFQKMDIEDSEEAFPFIVKLAPCFFDTALTDCGDRRIKDRTPQYLRKISKEELLILSSFSSNIIEMHPQERLTLLREFYKLSANELKEEGSILKIRIKSIINFPVYIPYNIWNKKDLKLLIEACEDMPSEKLHAVLQCVKLLRSSKDWKNVDNIKKLCDELSLFDTKDILPIFSHLYKLHNACQKTQSDAIIIDWLKLLGSYNPAKRNTFIHLLKCLPNDMLCLKSKYSSSHNCHLPESLKFKVDAIEFLENCLNPLLKTNETHYMQYRTLEHWLDPFWKKGKPLLKHDSTERIETIQGVLFSRDPKYVNINGNHMWPDYFMDGAIRALWDVPDDRLHDLCRCMVLFGCFHDMGHGISIIIPKLLAFPKSEMHSFFSGLTWLFAISDFRNGLEIRSWLSFLQEQETTKRSQFVKLLNLLPDEIRYPSKQHFGLDMRLSSDHPYKLKMEADKVLNNIMKPLFSEECHDMKLLFEELLNKYRRNEGVFHLKTDSKKT